MSAKVFIHPTAEIDEGVILGTGSKIWHFCHILSKSIIGKNCIIGQNVMIGPDVRIASGCKIQNNVSVYQELLERLSKLTKDLSETGHL